MQKIEMQPHAQLRPTLWHGRLAFGGVVLTLSLNRSAHTASGVLVNRLAVLRRERGLAIRELAGQLSIAPTTLAALEQGRYQPSLSLAFRLSEFFDLPIEAIFPTSAGRSA